MSRQRTFRTTIPLILLSLLSLLLASPHPGAKAQLIEGNSPTGCWSILPTPIIDAQSSSISALSASSPNNVWAVGSATNNTPDGRYSAFAMRFDGAGWQLTPTNIITESLALQDVAALSPDNVWAVGSYNNGVTFPNNTNSKLILHWDGKVWKVSMKGGIGQLNGVWATGPNDVWAVGEMGRGQNAGVSVVHHWNGTGWSETPIGTPFLNDVVALSPDDVWIAGSAIYHWDGRQWALSERNTGEKFGLLALAPNNIWAVGQAPVGAEAVHWDGTSWKATPAGADRGAKPLSVAALGQNDFWAVGLYEAGALMLHWDGSNWAGIPNPIPGFNTEMHSVIKVGEELWAAGKRTISANGSDIVIARHSPDPCPEPGPATPLNPPVPLPGTESLPFVTGKTISGIFLTYWQDHGGLQQQGYPITSVIGEVSDLDGKVYTVQYFERSIFEYHPELKGTQYEVLLSQLGTFQYERKYRGNGAPNQRPNQDAGTLFFPETGKKLGGSFLRYWQDHGGLAQQGFPISDEFTEVSEVDGKPYTVQYFERSVFEWHPENAPPYNVLLSLLGNFRYQEKYTPGQNITPTNKPRLIVGNVQDGRIEGGGRYLVWNETQAANAALRSYDAEQNRRFEIAVGNPRLLAADSQRAVWRTGSDQVAVFNLSTSGAFTLTVPARQLAPPTDLVIEEYALDDNMLYYKHRDASGKSHIAVQNTIRREDDTVIVTPNAVSGLQASNGTAIWIESNRAGSLEQSLHIWNAQARSEVVPASGFGAFSGYGSSGDYLVWSFYNRITDQATYLFNTRTGNRKVLNTGAASSPVIGNGIVAWVRWPDRSGGEIGGWDIEIYDIEVATTTTIVQGLPAMPGNLTLLNNNRLAFTADIDLTAPGYDLFLVDLDE